MRERVFLKLGGSLITDKECPLTPRLDVLQRLGQEIRDALQARPDLELLVGHGSGSFGHVVGRKYRTRDGVQGREGWQGYAATGRAAAQLNRLVCDALWEAGVPVLSLQPSASARCRDGELVSLEVAPLSRALENGLVPLVFGDVALDAVRGGTIISTEEIFAYLVRQFPPHRILLAGQVAGVFTEDPGRNPAAPLISRLTPGEVRDMEGALGGSHGVDVTGGMWSKVWEMTDLVEANPTLTVQILSGEPSGNVREALVDVKRGLGTRITG